MYVICTVEISCLWYSFDKDKIQVIMIGFFLINIQN